MGEFKYHLIQTIFMDLVISWFELEIYQYKKISFGYDSMVGDGLWKFS